MMDLVEFLCHRIDEDEQSARATIPGPWRISSSGIDVVADEAGLIVMENFDDPGPWHRALPEFMVRHDPDRELREVEAKRLLLDDIERNLADDPTDESALFRARAMALPYQDNPDYDKQWWP